MVTVQLQIQSVRAQALIGALMMDEPKERKGNRRDINFVVSQIVVERKEKGEEKYHRHWRVYILLSDKMINSDLAAHAQTTKL